MSIKVGGDLILCDFETPLGIDKNLSAKYIIDIGNSFFELEFTNIISHFYLGSKYARLQNY